MSTDKLIKESKQRRFLWKIWFAACAYVTVSSYLSIIMLNHEEYTLFITSLSIWILSMFPIYYYEKSKKMELKLQQNMYSGQPVKNGTKFEWRNSLTVEGKTYHSYDFNPVMNAEDFAVYSSNFERIPMWLLPSISSTTVSCKICFNRVSATEFPKHVNSNQCRRVWSLEVPKNTTSDDSKFIVEKISDEEPKITEEKIKCIHCSRTVLKRNLSRHVKSFTCKNIQERKKAKKQKARERQKKRDEREKKIREAKENAFSRKNFQADHGSISMQKKDKVWNESGGRCYSCTSPSTSQTNPLSFWWTIHPDLKVLLLCDRCAKKLDLVEENLIEIDSRSRRIKAEVRDKVWKRDGGLCVNCGSNERLEFDHIIPHSKGGSNTVRNIQLLCEICNRRKSDNIQ